MQDSVEGILIWFLLIFAIAFVIEWLSLPWKVEKTNKLLEEILEKLDRK